MSAVRMSRAETALKARTTAPFVQPPSCRAPPSRGVVWKPRPSTVPPVIPAPRSDDFVVGAPRCIGAPIAVDAAARGMSDAAWYEGAARDEGAIDCAPTA